MRLRGVITAGLALIASALAAPAALGWGDTSVRDSPGGTVATCLRSAADGRMLGVLGPRRGGSLTYDLLSLDGAAPELRARLSLGVLDSCPQLAARPQGPFVVAGVVRRGRSGAGVRAVVSDGGPPSATLALGRPGTPSTPLAVAVSARGDAIVAWAQTRGGTGDGPRQVRLMTSRRLPGAPLGPAIAETGWLKKGVWQDTPVAAGYDAAGRVTVAWARPTAWRQQDITKLETLSAAPGAPFGVPLPVGRPAGEPETIVLDVAANGRALLALDASDPEAAFEAPEVQVAERVGPEGAFEPLGISALNPGRGANPLVSGDPTVAVRDDGAGVIAWRRGRLWLAAPGVSVAVRRPGTAFRAHAITPPGKPIAERRLPLVSVGLGPGYTPPLDDSESLDATLTPSGELMLAWTDLRREPFQDQPVAAKAVAGDVGGRFGPIATLGCACRTVSGVATAVAGGAPAVAYTDNVSFRVEQGFEFPLTAGRLHLASPVAPAPTSSPPRLWLHVRPQTLRFGQALQLRVRCDRPCDVRATIAGRKPHPIGPLAVGTAYLPDARPSTLRVRPRVRGNIAPRRPGRVGVLVRAYARDGSRYAERTIYVRARRR